MEPLTIILKLVATAFLSQFIKEEGYTRLRRILFPTKTYVRQLISVIEETIDEYEEHYPKPTDTNKFPFYQSQILFEELNKHILYKTKYSTFDGLVIQLKQNPRVIIPSGEQLNFFYDLFSKKIKADQKLNKLFIDENYKSKIFELDEVLKRIQVELSQIKENIAAISSQIIFSPSKEWFTDQCQASILDLGNRYTPELNFELEISIIFDGIGRTANFKKKVTKMFDVLLINAKKILNNKAETEELINPLKNSIEEAFKLFTTIEFQDNTPIPIDQLNQPLDEISKRFSELENYYREEERKLQKEKNDYKFYHKYGYELRHIHEFLNSFYEFDEFINGHTCELANNPYLLLDGEAGIGKSHMLGDIISKRIKNGHESVFFLGQQFVTDEDPWTQIFKKLRLNITSNSFLNALNERAEKNRSRIIIFIDAINEGRGKHFWHDNLNSFINELRKYEWLGLVLSIRSSYKELILPKVDIEKFQLIEHTLYGFRNNEYEASKLYFDNYNIELPNVPLLHPEFQNPLFLKLFCEGISKAGLNKIPDGLQGITSILGFFIKNVNVILASPKRFDYSNGINLVDKSIKAIIQYKIQNDLRQVDYEKASEIIEDVVSKFVTKKGRFLEELISEGIFSKNLFWKGAGVSEEGVYLAYERFEDHLMAQYLLEKSSDIEIEFKDGGNLFPFVKDKNDIYINKGLIDAFAIQIPEKTGKEFYHYVPHLENNYSIVESFVESLLWRKVTTINEPSIDYVNTHVMSYKGTQDLFWETILSVTSIPEHYFNAYSLHKNLIRLSLAERDAGWTQRLKDKYSNDSSVKRLIDWAWSEGSKSHISDESIKLSSIALAWFHTSTNRELRDSSTKAMVSLLQNRIKILMELLEMFQDVNDPYVCERLYAVAYGCALRTEQKELLQDLSEHVHKLIFKNKDEVYPHALLRDYARGIVEYSHYKNLELSFDISEVRPPYKSQFESVFPSNEEITEKYYLDYDSDKFKDHHWGQNSILSSMATEHGRTMYGDFGRYTFQSALDSWNLDESDLSNLAIKWIFEKYGYDVELHGIFDREIGSGRSRDSIPNERIGKKYQWIALHEMVARISDDFTKYEEWGYDKKKEEPYQGTWSPSIRDIDRTVLLRKTGRFDEDKNDTFWWTQSNPIKWELTHEEWVHNLEDLPSFDGFIQVKDNEGEEWLILEGYPEWSEPKKIGEEKWDRPHKRLWSHINSYLIKAEDTDKFMEGLANQSFMNRWMPQSPTRYEIFSREYYWSPAHKYFMTEYYEGNEWREVFSRKDKHNEYIESVIVTTENYSWSNDTDKSKMETISYIKPSSRIFYGMNLRHGDREGEFVDETQKLICFATNVHHDSKSFLCIRKDSFVKYLAENKFNIFWTILGEKQVIGGMSYGAGFSGALIFNGLYTLDGTTIKGSFHTENR